MVFSMHFHVELSVFLEAHTENVKYILIIDKVQYCAMYINFAKNYVKVRK